MDRGEESPARCPAQARMGQRGGIQLSRAR